MRDSRGDLEGLHPKLLACALLSHLDGGERTEVFDAVLYFNEDKKTTQEGF